MRGRTRGAVVLALLAIAVMGCTLAGPTINEAIARDIATYGAEYQFTGLHEIQRVTIGSDTYALLLGLRPDGLRAIGLLGYHPDGMGFESDWDAAEPGVAITFSVSREGTSDGAGGSAWTARAFGLMNDPRVTTIRVVADDGAVTELPVRPPGYVFKVPTTETGTLRVVFLDAAGQEITSFTMGG